MSKKFVKFIVIFLSVLIIIAFIAIIYGSYLNLRNINDYNIEEISLGLKNEEKVVDLKAVNEKYILIIISGGDRKGIVYDIKNNKIIRNINK